MKIEELPNRQLLDNMIIGRVDPSIYAFSTGTIPNYIKVGDTYRPVSTRLKEWQKHFEDLEPLFEHSAKLDSGKIFRDYAVHYYLEVCKGFHRLERTEIAKDIYYSNEFFKDAKISDVKEAIEDIKHNEGKPNGKYQYYSSSRLPEQPHYKRVQTFEPRDNQQEAINKFKVAKASGRTNLLMYAVMRFGKSFTSMCCATEMDAKFVLIVSAKADVRKEWQETVESHVRFEGFNYYTEEDLRRDNNIVSHTIDKGEKVALFLTLQDLQGDTIKDKHKEIFSKTIDLLIIDETHFGARAEVYGKVLRQYGLKGRKLNKELEAVETSDEFEEELKSLKATIRLHLSGTPYRILMGDEFAKDDIIVFCQYTDIVDAKDKWDEEHGADDDTAEWKNPYYGFPQMIRFAFKPNRSSIRCMEDMKSKGITYAFSELFRTKSIIKETHNLHKEFNNRNEILELLEVIDGSKEDENLLGFLDYDKIKDGQMCRHIVCVLPFRASCDALEALIKSNQEHFKNLSNYTIINIAGVEDERTYADTDRVKEKIESCEAAGQKTITLTVNRMLTGSTVKEWDTMLYFKDTASPQEYDQAIFRIQNQYIKTYQDEDGVEIRYNMKPQTLLVDFDPDRMFRMQELKSQFYNVNTDKNGNDKLKQRIARELVISPIITINHNLLQQVEAKEVMAVVQQYSQNKSIIDEATGINYDFSLLGYAGFRKEIENINEIDAAKGIEFRPNEDSGDDDYQIPDYDTTKPTGGDTNETEGNSSAPEENEEESIKKKFAAYYAKILFFAFLTETTVSSLNNIIQSVVNGNTDDRRIFRNLGLKVPPLWLIQTKCNPFILSKLDYKIQNISALMRDSKLTPLERAQNALTKFARISLSEVVTPSYISEEIVKLLPLNELADDEVILDISTIEGELTVATINHYGESIKSRMYCVTTSDLAYELTRKVYRLLNIPLDHILNIKSLDLITVEGIESQMSHLKIGAVVGAPPFSEKAAGGRGDGSSAIYQRFFNFAKDKIAPRFISMMTQCTWYTGGKPQNEMRDFREYMLTDNIEDRHIREFHDYPNIGFYIKGVTTLRGGICIFLWDKEHHGDCLFINKVNGKDYPKTRPLRYTTTINKAGIVTEFKADFLIRWNKGLSILKKVLDKEHSFIPDNGMMRTRNPFGFPEVKDGDKWLKGTTPNDGKIKVHLDKGKCGYVTKDAFTKEKGRNELLNRWKVLVAKSSSGGDEIPHRVISKPIAAGRGEVTAHTHYVIDGVKNRAEAENLRDYMCTRFFRFMVNLLRSNQNMRVDMYQFAPRLDFTRSWTDSQLYDRYELDNDERYFIESLIKEI